MGFALRGKGCSRTIVGILAVAWVPYILTRCVEGIGHEGCPVSAAAHEETSSQHHHGDSSEHHHARRGVLPAAHQTDDHEHPSERVCCDLTGKSAFVKSAPPSTAAPAVVLVTLYGSATALIPPEGPRSKSRAAAPTHHPPPYLRFATLLI